MSVAPGGDATPQVSRRASYVRTWAQGGTATKSNRFFSMPGPALTKMKTAYRRLSGVRSQFSIVSPGMASSRARPPVSAWHTAAVVVPSA